MAAVSLSVRVPVVVRHPFFCCRHARLPARGYAGAPAPMHRRACRRRWHCAQRRRHRCAHCRPAHEHAAPVRRCGRGWPHRHDKYALAAAVGDVPPPDAHRGRLPRHAHWRRRRHRRGARAAARAGAAALRPALALRALPAQRRRRATPVPRARAQPTALHSVAQHGGAGAAACASGRSQTAGRRCRRRRRRPPSR